MKISKLRVTDDKGVEHEWEAEGWLYVSTHPEYRVVSAAVTQTLEPECAGMGCGKFTPCSPKCEEEFRAEPKVVHRCPECAAGKHVNCVGTALDYGADEIVPCGCTHD